ncbi:MAG: hypothetical protein NVS4B11_08230 [Ktedonobacteraceae bacterium]
MVSAFDQTRRWNIFARELEDILAVRELRLSHLDDRGVVNHREKVRRLQNSLTSPKHLTTLNPTEMERLIAVMQLTDIEQKRLIAALLATAVEMTLMDRITPEVALMAADDVFTILFAAMKAQPDMVVTTSIKAGVMVDDDDPSGDALFLQALDLIDRATLSLHASKNATTLQAQTTHAHEALAAFTRTLELLKQSRSPQPESEGWIGWYNEALEGRRMAETLVQATQGAEQ